MNYMNLMSQRGADSAPCNPIFIFTLGCVLARNGREDSYLSSCRGESRRRDGRMLLDDLSDNAMKLSRLLQRVASNARVTVCSLP